MNTGTRIRTISSLSASFYFVADNGMATSGSDMNWYNKIISLGWADDVII